MTIHANPDARVDGFLAKLRAGLRGMPEPEIEDILREIRSHVTDLAEADGSDVESAIRSMGDPVELATTYRAENLVIQAECSGSPLWILQALRYGSRTRLGRFTGSLLYLFGYVNVITLWLAAVAKAFAPSRTGLWYAPGTTWPLTLVTDGAAPTGARELLGWWLIPAAAVSGLALKYAIDHIARWWLRRYRRSKATAGASTGGPR
jgi:hypothetical protein